MGEREHGSRHLEGQRWLTGVQWAANGGNAVGKAIREFHPAHRVAAHEARRQFRSVRLERGCRAERATTSQGDGSPDAGTGLGELCIARTMASPRTSATFPASCLEPAGLTATPDNPRGSRSKSFELRCKGAGEWNVYDVVCVDGTVKLSINGKFVNSIRNSSMRKGYLCLESEGSEIHFRNIRILELPPGITKSEQTATLIK